MPIYEYQCQSCGHRLEAIQSFSDAPLTDCPECRQAKLSKLLSAPSFQLKGSGWYVTDFKNSGNKPKPAETAPKSENDAADTGTKKAVSTDSSSQVKVAGAESK